MARLRQRDTGSVIVVPDEDAAAVLAFGHYERADESGAKKAPAKKAAAKADSNK